ncbi:MAG: SLC13/DASS family transporter [Myxococcales bacterium]|nr:SLC13/DASS family transporter [Myxococcales bacterium]MCB9734609.1 SLC13/DASS family transporter [Deltaproteobacteria bacterium]
MERSSVTARRTLLLAGPLIAGALIVAAKLGTPPVLGLAPNALIALALAVWMAIWWISEVVPIGATALLPMVVLPLLGVTPMKAVVTPYMNPFIVLMMAGFMAALAIERWGLHRRLALRVLVALGASPKRLVLGMMLATAISSMWISNTASTLIMLPIGTALLRRLEDGGASEREVHALGTAMFLGIAYSASIGGLGTPIGTPPNLIYMGVYEKTFGSAPTFAGWMGIGVPLVAVAIPLVFWWLTRGRDRFPASLPVGSRGALREDLRRLGPMSADERAVAGVFLTMIVLWITSEVKVGDTSWGWAPALGLSDYVHEATVAVLGAVALFAWPSRTRPGERLLDWPTASRIPWDVVLLFGGGVALADAFSSTGLSKAVSEGLSGLAGLPVPLMILIIALVVTFLTEVTSNTATATVLMPILAVFAKSANVPPAMIMLPAALSASCAFMLPVATPPNAIVFGTKRITIAEMARAGFVLNLGGAVLVTIAVYLLA